jgi:hypothetical protein
MGFLFFPKVLVDQALLEGNTFKFGTQIRTNDNINCSYSTEVPISLNSPEISLTVRFHGAGMWNYNSNTSKWKSISKDNAEDIVSSGSLIYADFGPAGIWKWDGNEWAQISQSNPKNMVATGLTLYGDFGPAGIYMWDGYIWTQISKSHPVNLVASDSTLYGDFGKEGVWRYDGNNKRYDGDNKRYDGNNQWTQISPSNPKDMTAPN